MYTHRIVSTIMSWRHTILVMICRPSIFSFRNLKTTLETCHVKEYLPENTFKRISFRISLGATFYHLVIRLTRTTVNVIPRNKGNLLERIIEQKNKLNRFLMNRCHAVLTQSTLINPTYSFGAQSRK